MDTNRLTLRIRGRDEDNGDVRFDDFLKQLNAWRIAITETERSFFSDKDTVYFKVVDLKKQSPASVVIEAVSADPSTKRAEYVVEKFFTSLQKIEKGEAPEGLTYSAYQAFKQVPSMVGNGVTELTISRNGDSVPVNKSLVSKIDEILGPDDYEYGWAIGMLEKINLHANQNVFTIYSVAHKPPLRCVFHAEQREDAIRAVGKHVEVRGFLKYKHRQRLSDPYEIIVDNIEILPPEKELPTFGQLRGTALRTDDTLASEELIGRLRDEWEN